MKLFRVINALDVNNLHHFMLPLKYDRQLTKMCFEIFIELKAVETKFSTKLHAGFLGIASHLWYFH